MYGKYDFFKFGFLKILSRAALYSAAIVTFNQVSGCGMYQPGVPDDCRERLMKLSGFRERFDNERNSETNA